ncbi:hypothetical protein F511_10134 [Dorcoceras hygrometricum]|uniref:Uncharacterized protein n=1 Tax=Dorcoceras hygrometricum TaxID=472368 RepID=A0A2Z7CEL4_9LAMI|nr:hypothetical protein F511_10134 [Dorcoceras hygrometricum]
METSRVKSVVRNQAEAKLNQLEHDEPAETMNHLQALKRKDEPAVSIQEEEELQAGAGAGVMKISWSAQRIEEVAKRSSRSDKPVAKQLTTHEEFTKDECQLLSSIQMAKATRSLQKKRTQVLFSCCHTVAAVVQLRSLGVLTAAGCGIGSVHAVVRSNLLVEPFKVEEGEM